MLTCLMKKLLPFTLTFLTGAALGGLLNFGGWKRPQNIHTYAGADFYVKEAKPRGRACGGAFRQERSYDRPLNILSKPRPDYSLRAFQNGRQSTVVLRVVFGSDGQIQAVSNVVGTSTNEAFLDAAKKAAWQIEFEPATDGGVPVTVTRDIEYVFNGRDTETRF